MANEEKDTLERLKKEKKAEDDLKAEKAKLVQEKEA